MFTSPSQPNTPLDVGDDTDVAGGLDDAGFLADLLEDGILFGHVVDIPELRLGC